MPQDRERLVPVFPSLMIGITFYGLRGYAKYVATRNRNGNVTQYPDEMAEFEKVENWRVLGFWVHVPL